uniref:Uncharacterized protein n=1 Tax=Odontella aurita TaxID=265563 RepID=A0A7S4MQ56_9STRA
MSEVARHLANFGAVAPRLRFGPGTRPGELAQPPMPVLWHVVRGRLPMPPHVLLHGSRPIGAGGRKRSRGDSDGEDTDANHRTGGGHVESTSFSVSGPRAVKATSSTRPKLAKS